MRRTIGRALRAGLAGRVRRSGRGVPRLLSCVLGALGLSGLAGPAAAVPIHIGGVDVQSQYTGYNPVVTDSGVFTFNDALSGSNPSPEPGTVTTSDIAALIDGRIDLELMLDTSSFAPATDSVTAASFVGTGAGPEIVIWDSTWSTVLLTFQVSFVDVTAVTPEVPPFIPISLITLGNDAEDQLGVSSLITVAGGTLAGDVGGVGTQAVLQLTISDPTPAVTTSNLNGYLNDSFTAGIPGTTPTFGVTWDIAIVPEPSVFALVAVGLLAALRLRGAPRRS